MVEGETIVRYDSNLILIALKKRINKNMKDTYNPRQTVNH